MGILRSACAMAQAVCLHILHEQTIDLRSIQSKGIYSDQLGLINRLIYGNLRADSNVFSGHFSFINDYTIYIIGQTMLIHS